MWLSLLLNKYVIGLILLVALIGGGFFYVYHLRSEVSSLTAKNTGLETDLKVSQDSVKTLQTSIDQQNTAINKLQTDADARVASHASELAAAQKATILAVGRAGTILATKPPPDASLCNSANALIDQEIQNAKK